MKTNRVLKNWKMNYVLWRSWVRRQCLCVSLSSTHITQCVWMWLCHLCVLLLPYGNKNIFNGIIYNHMAFLVVAFDQSTVTLQSARNFFSSTFEFINFSFFSLSVTKRRKKMKIKMNDSWILWVNVQQQQSLPVGGQQNIENNRKMAKIL